MKDARRTVSDLMTQTVVAVSCTAPYKEIAKTLAEWRGSAVPVLEGEGRVIGVVSEADLLAKEEFKDHAPSRIGRRRRHPVRAAARRGVVPLVARLVRGVEGVVNVKFELSAPTSGAPEPPAVGPQF